MKTLVIKGNLKVNGSLDGKNIVAHWAENENDMKNAIVINGDVIIEGNVKLDDDQQILSTGGVAAHG